MKRMNKITLLTGIFLCLLCFFLILQKADLTGLDDAPEITETTAPLLTAAPGAVTAVSWTAGEAETAFTLDGESWRYTRDETLPVEKESLQTLLESFCAAESTKTITSPGDLAQYGLEEPVLQVTLTAGETMTFAFGDVTELSGDQYCLTEDGSIHLVAASVAELFSVSEADFVKKDEVPAAKAITEFSVTNSEGGLTAVHHTEKGLSYTDDFVWFTPKEDGAAALDTQRTETLLNKALQPGFGAYAANGTTDGVLADYGLSPADMTVTVRYADAAEGGETQPAEFTISFGADADGNTYANLSGSTRIWQVEVDTYEAFASAVTASLLPEKAFSLDWADVTEATVALDGEEHSVIRMKREVTPDTGEDGTAEPYLETYWLFDNAETELNPVKDALNAVSAAGDASAEAELQAAEITFTFRRDNELHPVTTVAFTRLNGTQCLTVIDGEPATYASRSDVIALKEAVNAILLGG